MKLLTKEEMKEQLKTQDNLDDYCVDLETACEIILEAVLPLCKD